MGKGCSEGPFSPGRPGMGPGTPMSAVWDYFDKNEEGGKCKMDDCQQQVRRSKSSSSTKGFWDHLKCHHPEIYKSLRDAKRVIQKKKSRKRKASDSSADENPPNPSDDAVDSKTRLIMMLQAAERDYAAVGASTSHQPAGDEVPMFPPSSDFLEKLLQEITVMAAGPGRAEVRLAAKEFVNFLNKSVTPYHAVQELSNRLKEEGFVELKEAENWNIEKNGRYFVTKNATAIFAFAIGGRYVPGNGFTMIAAHTDSPSLRVRPISKITASDYLQVGVSTYGGGIWRTWFDRDLSLAGAVTYKKNDSLVRHLMNLARPVLYIPNLAIHFCTDRNKFECNNEKELRPILATLAADKLNEQDEVKDELKGGDSAEGGDITKEHHSALLRVIANEVCCDPHQIVDLDLYLYDSQAASIGGIYEEFISGQRLDNLVGAYTTVFGLIESLKTGDLNCDENIRFAACYDNEECGSESAQGAESKVTEWFLRRLAAGGSSTAFEEAIGKSYLLSVDNAHAVHPNYSEKHEQNHKPAFHGGVTVKVNVNQRYATTSATHAVLKNIASLAGQPLQKVVVRNDMPCGTTVGPILSSQLGIQTADVGCVQLAMHSIRELMCTSSIHQATQLYSAYFNHLPSVLKSLQ